MPSMTELMQNPFQVYRVGEWGVHYDPDLEMFMVSHAEADGCDFTEEFGSYEAAAAFMQDVLGNYEAAVAFLQNG